MPRITIDVSDSEELINLIGKEQLSFVIDNDDVVELLRKFYNDDTNDEIIRDLENAFMLSNAVVDKSYELSNGIKIRMRVSRKFTKIILDIGDYQYTIYNKQRNSVDIIEVKGILDRLRRDPRREAFKIILNKDFNVLLTGLIPSDIANIFPEFTVKFNIKYAIPKEEFLDDEAREKIMNNAHLLVGVYRDEVKNKMSGILGSLVRKGFLLTQKELKLYVPTERNGRLSKNEKEVYETIREMFSERLEKFNKIMNSNMTPEDIIAKIRGYEY